MICGRCHQWYENGRENACPHCGAPREAEAPGYVKSSTILIYTGSTEGVYRSLAEVPAGLRTELLRSTNGANAGTILIADRKGREEIARAVRQLPAVERPQVQAVSTGLQPDRRRQILAAILLAVLLLLVWAVYTCRG